MVTLIIEAFFALVFVRSLIAYSRRRDTLQRDLALVCAPITVLLVLEIIRRVAGAARLPAFLALLGLTLLLAQPYLTLRLVGAVRPVPRLVNWSAFALFVLTTLPWYFFGARQLPVVTLTTVTAFFVVQGWAATLLMAEARRRTGAPRARLTLAAVATAVLGLCLLVAGTGPSVGRAENVIGISGQVLALLSGLSYVVAFLPPRWLRQIWANGTAYRVHQQMANASISETPEQTWHRYAMTVREASGASTAIVLLPSVTGPVCTALSGDAGSGEVTTTAPDLQHVLDRAQPVVVPTTAESPLLAYAQQAGARVLTAVPLQLPSAEQGALVLLNRRQPLFVEDDARLLGELGAQAAIVAERGAAAAAIRAMNTELEDRVQQRTAQLRLAQAALEDVNQQLEAQNAMLARSNEELQRFAYVASHDLQEPLRKIISFSGLLVERMPAGLDADTSMYVDRIVGSASRMKRLIEDLLMFSRTGGQVEMRPVDCERALTAVLDSLAIALTESQATVTHDPLPIIHSNRTSIERLLQNLIGNALKYRSEAPPRIHVGAERLDEGWRLTVTDNGIGLDMTYADRIFQVFQRLHPRGQYDGTGIGLAVCKRIVESAGGRIGVDSVPGAGATFWCVLPAPLDGPSRKESDALGVHAG
jgi:signal transduction histidine kinase